MKNDEQESISLAYLRPYRNMPRRAEGNRIEPLTEPRIEPKQEWDQLHLTACEGNVNVDPREIGSRFWNWIQMAQNKANVVIKPNVQINQETSCPTE
jgi:hypothetical protein